jgi:hypothetical protein
LPTALDLRPCRDNVWGEAMRFAVGEAVVDVIVDDDDYGLPLSSFLPGVDLAALRGHRAVLEPDFLELAQDRLRVAIQSYVVRTGGRTVLIDSCIGDDRDRPQVPVWNQRQNTGFLDRMRRAGTDPAAVDIVLFRAWRRAARNAPECGE